MHREQWGTSRQLIPYFAVHHQPHCRINWIAFLCAPRTQQHSSLAHRTRVHPCQPARRWCVHCFHKRSLRQARGIIHHCAITALRHYKLAKLGQRRSVAQSLLRQRPPGSQLRHFARQHQHVRCQRQAMLHKIGRAGSAQRHDGFVRFERIPNRITQRLVHVRQQRHRAAPNLAPNRHHLLRQIARIIQRAHERAAAHLYIQHNRLRPGSNFFAHD